MRLLARLRRRHVQVAETRFDSPAFQRALDVLLRDTPVRS